MGAGVASEWALSGGEKYLYVVIKVSQRVNATASAAWLRVSATGMFCYAISCHSTATRQRLIPVNIPYTITVSVLFVISFSH